MLPSNIAPAIAKAFMGDFDPSDTSLAAHAVRNLAAAGSSHGNEQRNLIKMTPIHESFPAPYYVRTPMKVGPNDEVEYREWPILLPHEMFGSLYTNFREHFEARFGTQEDIDRYWRDVNLECPAMRNHPIKQRPDFMQRTIPLRLHGDGVPYLKNRSR